MLELVDGARRSAAAKQQSGTGQPVERRVEFAGGAARDRFDQFVRELAAEHSADLGDFLTRCTEPVEARDQRGIERGWYCERRPGNGRKDSGSAIAVGGF